MKKTVIGIVLLSFLVALIGCAARAPVPVENSSGATAYHSEVVVEKEVAVAVEAPAQPASGSPSGVPGDTERMIIRTADLSLVVTDAEPAMKSITDMVIGMGGYVADSSAWREGEQLRARMTVRVPAGDLDGALAAIKALAVRVQRENIGGQDVTEEYTDLNAQLVNLEATENELRELLAEVRQRTQKAEDILQVHRELTNIRGEIERVKGRMQYLSTLTAMATLNIELIPDVLAKPVVEPGWRPLETLKNASRALVNALKGLANALIWLVIYVLPLLILIAIPIVVIILLVRWLVRRARRVTKRQDVPKQ